MNSAPEWQNAQRGMRHAGKADRHRLVASRRGRPRPDTGQGRAQLKAAGLEASQAVWGRGPWYWVRASESASGAEHLDFETCPATFARGSKGPTGQVPLENECDWFEIQSRVADGAQRHDALAEVQSTRAEEVVVGPAPLHSRGFLARMSGAAT